MDQSGQTRVLLSLLARPCHTHRQTVSKKTKTQNVSNTSAYYGQEKQELTRPNWFALKTKPNIAFISVASETHFTAIVSHAGFKNLHNVECSAA